MCVLGGRQLSGELPIMLSLSLASDESCGTRAQKSMVLFILGSQREGRPCLESEVQLYVYIYSARVFGPVVSTLLEKRALVFNLSEPSNIIIFMQGSPSLKCKRHVFSFIKAQIIL